MTAKNPHIPVLDGVRGLAAVFVLLCHAGYAHFVPLVVGLGTFGVMLFYVLSGFLIAYHYLPSDFSLRYWVAFLVHRIVRVYPAFFLATFGYIIFPHHLPFGFPLIHQLDWHGLIPSWLLNENKGLFWTIPVEIKFYLAYPLLAISILLFTSWIMFFFIIGACLCICFGPENLKFLMFFYFFMTGALFAVILKKCNLGRIKLIYWEFLAILSFLGLFVCIGSLHFFETIRSDLWALYWLFAPLMAFSIMSMTQSKYFIYWLLANPLSRFIGKISYSLYLVHWFIINAARDILPLAYQNIFFVLILVFVIAWSYYILIERPFTYWAKVLSGQILKWPSFGNKSNGSP